MSHFSFIFKITPLPLQIRNKTSSNSSPPTSLTLIHDRFMVTKTHPIFISHYLNKGNIRGKNCRKPEHTICSVSLRFLCRETYIRHVYHTMPLIFRQYYIVTCVHLSNVTILSVESFPLRNEYNIKKEEEEEKDVMRRKV